MLENVKPGEARMFKKNIVPCWEKIVGWADPIAACLTVLSGFSALGA